MPEPTPEPISKVEAIDDAGTDADDNAGDGNLGEPVAPCPLLLAFNIPFTRTKIVEIKVVSLKFKTDHSRLLDNAADWAETGKRYAKPEWTYGVKSAPITHTMNRTVGVDVDFEVYPRDADPTDADVTGTAKFGSLVFTGKSSFKGGKVSMSFMSNSALPSAVGQLGGDIDWTIVTKEDGPFNAGASWGHKVYVTYGEPTGSAVTEKRVDYVTSGEDIAGKSGEKDCVDGIFKKMRGHHYAVGTPTPNPRWVIFGGTRADCGNLADAFRLACLMLGLPDKFKKGFVFPLLNKGGAKFDTEESASTSRTNTGAHLAQHGAKEILVFQDQNGLNNRYEGCIVYDGTYYCIGEARFKSPEEVMNAMVISTYWGYTKGGAEELCKNPGPAPVVRWQ